MEKWQGILKNFKGKVCCDNQSVCYKKSNCLFFYNYNIQILENFNPVIAALEIALRHSFYNAVKIKRLKLVIRKHNTPSTVLLWIK